MMLQQIIKEIETAKHPVAKALQKGEHFKVLAIGFKKGMVLKEHQAHLPTKLFVLFGQIIYKENGISSTVSEYEQTDIPINTMHSVEAIEDSLCLLTQG
jgi:quercetin dioxygenase-like cupin family protein